MKDSSRSGYWGYVRREAWTGVDQKLEGLRAGQNVRPPTVPNRQGINVTVTIKRAHLDELAAQLQSDQGWGDGGGFLLRSQAGEILRTLRTAEIKQLRG